MDNQQIAKLLMEGLEEKNKWGYGFRRISVHATNLNNYPYTFTAFGYKDQEGKNVSGAESKCGPMQPYGNEGVEPWNRHQNSVVRIDGNFNIKNSTEQSSKYGN